MTNKNKYFNVKNRYLDLENNKIISEANLLSEFLELVKNNDIEYKIEEFQFYIKNCTDKNGQLEKL